MPIVHRIAARTRDVGGTALRRLLPHARCRKVGPWVFMDHFGPVSVPAGQGFDVGPHPHCGLSTVTFLLGGLVEHRDSTGGHAIVRPNEIHWMRGGHGIVHSERGVRQPAAYTSHGLQLWCAHPDGQEEQEPRFDSYLDLPELDVQGARVQLLAGNGWGQQSPVDVTSPLVYALAHLNAGQSLVLPDHAERCVYPLSGTIAVDGVRGGAHELLVLDGRSQTLTAVDACVVAVLGGAPIGPRHIWWNLVHSDKGRLAEQADRWRRGDFPTIPGDDGAPILAPDEGPRP